MRATGTESGLDVTAPVPEPPEALSALVPFTLRPVGLAASESGAWSALLTVTVTGLEVRVA